MMSVYMKGKKKALDVSVVTWRSPDELCCKGNCRRYLQPDQRWCRCLSAWLRLRRRHQLSLLIASRSGCAKHGDTSTEDIANPRRCTRQTSFLLIVSGYLWRSIPTIYRGYLCDIPDLFLVSTNTVEFPSVLLDQRPPGWKTDVSTFTPFRGGWGSLWWFSAS